MFPLRLPLIIFEKYVIKLGLTISFLLFFGDKP